MTLTLIFILVCVGSAGGYIQIYSWASWRFAWSGAGGGSRVGIFGNARCGRGPPTWGPGGRWGVFILGLEIGSRNPRDPVGCWLKDRGLWPW